MRNRQTSPYTLDIRTTSPWIVVDELVERCPVTVAASGVDYQRAFIRFRAANDEEALRIAKQLTALEAVLHTGYGVNRRDVKELTDDQQG